MKIMPRVVLLGWVAALLVFAVTSGLTTPVARAATAPPHFRNGFGLTVVGQPVWMDAAERTFTFTVRSGQVPAYTVLPGQVSGEHMVMVTLPTEYNTNTGARYPVLYTLHGGPEYPEAARTKVVTERATEGVPLITVTPNGGGRGWYSNWVHPGALGPQNWESFHLDQLIPLIDANLRTIPTKQGRAISGHSMGGFGAFHYAEHRPDLFSYVGSFSGGLDLRSPEMRAAVAYTEQAPGYGTPTVPVDAIFGPPISPGDQVWNEQSPAQHVESLRGMGIALYAGDGGNPADDPIAALVENRARQTALTTTSHLDTAGIAYHFSDYGDGSNWAPGCTGKHSQQPCLQADMNHYVALIMQRLQHP